MSYRLVRAGVQRWDDECVDALVERHRRAIYQLCYRFVGNHEDASDLSQDVFLRAYRGLRNFRGQSSLGTWLYRIGVNVYPLPLSKSAPTDSFSRWPFECNWHASGGN